MKINHSDDVIKKCVGLLLLSLYTGRSIAELNTDIETNAQKILHYRPTKKLFGFIIHLHITPSRIRANHATKIQANQSTKMTLPLPLSLSYVKNGEYSSDCMNAIIKWLKVKLNMPVLSQARIETALYSFMSRNICSSQIASIITNRNSHRRADLWYSSHNEETIFTHYENAIAKMFDYAQKGIATTYLNTTTITNKAYIGSQNCPNYELASKFFAYLRCDVIHAKSFVDKFNAYNLWLWHIFLLLSSMRAVSDTPGLLNQFNLNIGIAWISDKEARFLSDSQRLLPMCEFLVTAVQDYLAYLHQCQHTYAKLDIAIETTIHHVLNSTRPLLNFMDNHYTLEPLSPSIIRRQLHENFRFKEDWTRHLGQKYLHEIGVDESLILSVFGHEMSGQESWHKHSSMSIGNVMSLKTHYQSLAVRLKLEQIA